MVYVELWRNVSTFPLIREDYILQEGHENGHNDLLVKLSFLNI